MISAPTRRSAVALALAGLGAGVVVATTSPGAGSRPGALQVADLGWVRVPAGTFLNGLRRG